MKLAMKQLTPITWLLFKKARLIVPLLFIFLMLEGPFSLKIGKAQGLVASDVPNSPPPPTWVIDPTLPGEDAPPVGRSLFDYVIAREPGEPRAYRIPYPFSDLLKYIERAGAQESSPRFKIILIPSGRSLHRYAAQPDFLRFPRILATIDSDEIKPDQGMYPSLYLKDRLFLAYQEKAGIIEVISYNEAAGRFEFQIVRNYHSGTSPQVVYANRKVCTVCHQNQAPIFPEPLWHETNAQPLIHTLIQSSQTDFSPIAHGVDIAAAFDAATDRANEILIAQKLWREGCETPGFPQQAIECRARLLTSALLQRLSGRSPFLHHSSSQKNDLLSSLAQIWKTQWPNGLGIPNPNIPNPPLAEVLTFVAPDVAEPYSLPTPDGPLHRHPLLDPITPRPPLTIWTFAPQQLSPWIHYVTTLSYLFSQADIQTLDDLLIKSTRHQHIPAIQYHSHCQTIIHAETEKAFDLTLECNPSSNSPVAPSRSFSLNGHLWFEQGTFQTGTFRYLQIGNEEEHAHLGIRDIIFRKDDAREIVVNLMPQFPAGLHARTRNGNFIQSLVFKWDMPLSQPEGSQERHMANTATLSILSDFSLIEKALKRMIHETASGQTDALDFAPFRRVKLAQSLFHHLDPPAPIRCCGKSQELPPVVLDAHSSSGKIFAHTNTPPAPLQLMDRYCGDCHHGEDPAPPGFLHGSIIQVENNLTHCAERMYVRLGMWQVIPSERGISPMPPPTALPRLTTMPGDWPQQEDFQLLRRYFQKLIANKGEPALSDHDLTLQEYEALPACLPPATLHYTSLPIP